MNKAIMASIVAATVTSAVVGAAPAYASSGGQVRNYSTNSHSLRASKVKPDFTGFCLTTWSGNQAGSNCTYGVGLYRQVIQCSAAPYVVTGPYVWAPSVYIGSCPHGIVEDAFVQFL